ncbi:MAG: hypothetical protein NVS2B7_10670 [Herpetosiphon sp.]
MAGSNVRANRGDDIGDELDNGIATVEEGVFIAYEVADGENTVLLVDQDRNAANNWEY